jgi:hypothetical protein
VPAVRPADAAACWVRSSRFACLAACSCCSSLASSAALSVVRGEHQRWLRVKRRSTKHNQHRSRVMRQQQPLNDACPARLCADATHNFHAFAVSAQTETLSAGTQFTHHSVND